MEIKKITTNHLKIKSCITNDFAWNPREILEVCQFKATEFRQLLLYTGPIVFKNVISEECYINFMALSISLRILLSLDHCFYLEYTHQLLKYFKQILHLADDYKIYGPLDRCSCFYFENYMKYLTRMLRKNVKPL